MLRIIRGASEEQFIMIFFIITVSVGTFSAQTARTINKNNDHRIRYLAGADLMFQELWRVNRPMPGSPEPVVFFEPDYMRFTQFDQVESQTQVKIQEANIRTSALGNLQATMMAVETDTFGNTIWFRRDLLGVHINHFLNVLANHPEGVLLSECLRGAGFRVGDGITFTGENGDTARCVVMGFVTHWPAYNPAEGHPLIVANLGYLQTVWGVQPYQIWMRTNTESNHFLGNFVFENRLQLTNHRDADALVAQSRSAPVLQGINGILTVVFIINLIICFAGFLIYWILSVHSRVLQFGIFRALGMRMRSVISLLIYEQLFITFTAIALGAAVGEIAARLYVPLILTSYTAADRAIPLTPVREAADYANLYLVTGVMIFLGLIILAVYVSRIKITQALKLGED
jgi:putative ABC transport system permease protein